MSWNDFFDDVFSDSSMFESDTVRRLDRQVERLRLLVANPRQDSSAARGDLRDEIEVLHANFARSLLLLQSLTTLLLRKKLVSREELQSIIRELDVLDGQPDNALSPSALPGMQTRPSERRSTEATLDDLARRPALDESTSPREFLKQLGNRELPNQ